jgi:hypothetical protein
VSQPQKPVLPQRASGYCTYCDRWVRDGVVIGDDYGNSGGGRTIVRHEAHLGLARPVGHTRPRRFLE